MPGRAPTRARGQGVVNRAPQKGLKSADKKGIGPRAVNEMKTFQKLPKVEVKPGDILIEKHFKNTDGVVKVIRVGQAMFSHMKGGSSNSEHMAIVWSVGAEGIPGTVAEANNGISVDPWKHTPSTVYRCTDERLLRDIMVVAGALTKARMVNGVSAQTGGYSQSKAWKSLLRSRKFGNRALKYVERIWRIVYNLGNAQPKDFDKGSNMVPSMFCSQFVTTCIEVAGYNQGRPVLRCDPLAMSPKALEAILERSTMFKRVGRVRNQDWNNVEDNQRRKTKATMALNNMFQKRKEKQLEEMMAASSSQSSMSSNFSMGANSEMSDVGGINDDEFAALFADM